MTPVKSSALSYWQSSGFGLFIICFPEVASMVKISSLHYSRGLLFLSLSGNAISPLYSPDAKIRLKNNE